MYHLLIKSYIYVYSFNGRNNAEVDKIINRMCLNKSLWSIKTGKAGPRLA